MGRAANIHIIMALQRPETSVLDGAIRIIINGDEISKMRISRWYWYLNDSIIHKEMESKDIFQSMMSLDGYEISMGDSFSRTRKKIYRDLVASWPVYSYRSNNADKR